MAGPDLLAGRYELVSELGRGTQGAVLLALDHGSGKARRAIKLVPESEAERVRWELSILSRIAHPNLARVYELLRCESTLPQFSIARGSLALVSEVAEGVPADVFARVHARDRDALLSLAWLVLDRAARALSAVHAQGFVHGDVKPANLIVREDASDAMLVDLGLAATPGESRTLSGTPGFLSPEALRGELSFAADIYALGVTVWRLLSLRLDDASSRSWSEEVSRAFSDPTETEPLPPWVPEPLARLLVQMRAIDPAARPLPARELLRRVAVIAPARVSAKTAASALADAGEPSAAERALAVTTLSLAGQAAVVSELASLLEGSSVIVVAGPAGAGRSRVVREAVGRAQAQQAASGKVVSTYQRARELPSSPVAHAAILHIERGDDTSLAEAEQLVRAAQIAGQSCAVILECSHERAPEASCVRIEPLTAVEIEALLSAALPGHTVKAPLVREAAAVSGGFAGRLCRVLGAAFAAGDDPARAGVLRTHVGAAGGLPVQVPASACDLVDGLALAGGALPQAAALACAKDAEDLAAQVRLLASLGLCARGAQGMLELAPDLVRTRRAELTEQRRRAIAGRLPESSLAGPARAFLLSSRGEGDAAQRAFVQETEHLLRSGRPDAAERLASDALEALAGLEHDDEELSLVCAQALRALGRYDAALSRLSALSSARAGVERAELLRLLGRSEDARALLEQVLRREGESTALLASAEVVLARLELDAGRIDAAERHAEQAAAGGEPATALRAAEVAALALLARGDVVRARSRVEDALGAARAKGFVAAEARLTSVLAQVHRARGETQAARRELERACELADAAGEHHAAASFLVNLGAAQLDSGELGSAIGACREGARRLARLGRDRDLARVLYNLAFAAHVVGDEDTALSAAEHAIGAAARASDHAAEAFARVLRAEVWLERGEHERVRAELGAIDELPRFEPQVRRSVLARSSALCSRLGDVGRAERWLTEAKRAVGDDAEQVDVELLLSEAALASARHEPREALRFCEDARRLARERRELGVELAALLGAARAAEMLGDAALSRARYAEVRSLLDAAALTLLPADRIRLRGVAAYRAALAALPAAAATQTGDSAERWRRLAALAKRLTSPERLSRLYETVLDAAIDLGGAERGYLLWNDADGVARVRAGRGLGGLSSAADSLSRSIVERVMATGKPLSTVDASADTRLSSAASVHALALRSVLAVPIRVQGEVRGAIYLDDRLRPFAFGDEEVELLSDLADIAAIALESAALLRRERRAVRRLHVARERLARRVEAQTVELRALREVAQRAESYPGIVAHSVAMQDVLKLALRVARAEVPVLLRGESGTGKELVAKAIHAESLRKDRPFVTENCGGIPETLLESTLFGHVKGAFTGADRRRMGLFEIADGGTLFLDEIGEMTAAMQTRLLRVLSDGEIKPVGAERSMRVDVRVIAATHRDLETMVKSGVFREDLYYRLAVVNVNVPPLRDRVDDIAPLVAHFVAKHAPGRKLRVDKRTLERLRAERWPGNVRQLENEVRRALVLADDVLREDSFSFTEGAQSKADGEASRLDMRAQIDRLERELIARALETAKGNQTKAAELLGVSRFGLQKMQKRLARQN